MNQSDIDVTNLRDVSCDFTEINNLPDDHLCQLLCVKNCPSINEVSKLVEGTKDIIKILFYYPLCFKIIFEIEGKFKRKKVKAPKKHLLLTGKRFMIIFQSSVDEKSFIYFKNQKFDEIYSLNLLEKVYSKVIRDFAFKFLQKAIIENRKVSTMDIKTQITTLRDSNNRNLLFEAVIKNDLDLVKELIKFHFDMDDTMKISEYEEKRPIDIAWENENLEMVYEFLKLNSPFPKNFNEEKANFEIKNFLQICREMHDAVRETKVDKINELIQNNKGLRYYFNEKNVSAVKISLDIENIDTYKLMNSQGVYLSPEENIYEIIQPFDMAVKQDIIRFNFSLSKPLPDRHIYFILANTLITNDDDEDDIGKCSDSIKDALETLSEISEVKWCMKVIETFKKVKVHFDFLSETVQYKNPLKKQRENDYYHTFRLPAKDLLTEETNLRGMAVIAHDMCKFAMQLVFRNNSKPYSVNDKENKQKYKEVHKAHSYPISMLPHLIVMCDDEDEELNEIQENYKLLFKYFNEVVMPAMKASVPVLEKIEDENKEIKFEELTQPLKDYILNFVVEFQGLHVYIKDIADEKVLNELLSDQIKEMINEEKSIKVFKPLDKFEKIYIERFFISQENEEKVKTFEEITNEGQESRIFLLSDERYSGKSTVLRNLCLRLKEKYSDYFVTKIDYENLVLSSYIQGNEPEIDELGKLEIVLAKMFSKFSSLEKEIFKFLFRNGKVIFVYDDFDSITKNYRKFFLDLIENIKNLTVNQQWIFSRLTNVDEICVKFNIQRHKFVPLAEGVTDLFELSDSEIKKFYLLNNFKYFFLSSSNEAKIFDGIKNNFENSFEVFLSILEEFLKSFELNDEIFESSKFDDFIKRVEDFLGGNPQFMRKILLLNYETSQPHPLIFALNFKSDLTVKFHKMFLIDQELKEILLARISTTILSIQNLNLENIFEFYKEIFKFTSSLDCNQVDFARKTNEESFEKERNLAKFYFQLLTIVESSEISQSLIQIFVERNFGNIFDLILRSRVLITKIYEIFDKFFTSQKESIAKLITNELTKTNFFMLNSDETFTDECFLNIEYFWIKAENFFNADQKLMKEIFLSENKSKNLLIISIFYDLKFLKELYFKYCEVKDFWVIFKQSLDTLKQFYNEEKLNTFFKHGYWKDSDNLKKILDYLISDKNFFDKLKENENLILFKEYLQNAIQEHKKMETK